MSKLEPLRSAVALSPDNVPLLLLLANACMEEWSLEEGRETFERVLRLEPGRVEAKLGIAKILHLLGKISEAIVRTEGITREHPAYAPAWIFLARLNLGEGNRDQARANYEQALKLDPVSKDTSLERDLFPASKPGAGKNEPEKVPVVEESWSQSNESGEPGALKSADIEQPKMKFEDVGGMEEVKEEIRMKIIYPPPETRAFPRLRKKDRRRRPPLRPSRLW